MPKQADFEVKLLVMDVWIFYHKAVHLSFSYREMFGNLLTVTEFLLTGLTSRKFNSLILQRLS